MYNCLYKFIEEHNLSYNLQFVFRQKHSASYALILLTDKIDNGSHGCFRVFLSIDFFDFKENYCGVSKVLR